MPDNMTIFLENAGYRKDTFGCQAYTDQRLRDSFVICAGLLPAEPKWDHISNHVGRGSVFIRHFSLPIIEHFVSILRNNA